VAHDVFLNFFERWNRQAGKYGHLNSLDSRVFDIGNICIEMARDLEVIF